MKKTRKLPLILLAATIIIATVVVVFAMNISADTEGYYTYTVSNGEATITDIDPNIVGGITIPSTLGGAPVTSIGNNAFDSCINLTSVTIPNSVTSIGDSAFYACPALTSVTIPDSVTSIGKRVFSSCQNLASVTIPNSVTNIGEGAFFSCTSLVSVIIPNSVTSIEKAVFSNCRNLANVTIPNSVTSIGESAFINCYNLQNITIPDSVTSIGNYAFDGCTSLASITIPNSVTTIEDFTFAGCNNLTSVTIPEDVTSIGNCAFGWCSNLPSITIPNSVTSIGEGAFYGCESLTSITIPNGVTNIGDETFINCTSLTSITIPDSVTSIGNYAFDGCTSLASITIPNSVTSIGDNAFSCCTSLTSITIPNSVTSISRSVFSECTSLVSVTIPNSVVSIDSYAFHGCTGLTSITIPDSLTNIGYFTFLGCTSLVNINVDENNSEHKVIDGNLYTKDGKMLIQYAIGKTDASFEIPEGVTHISDTAFASCTSLTSITIPNSVTHIYDFSFAYCINLEKIIFCGTETEWNAITKGEEWDSGTGEYTVVYHEYDQEVVDDKYFASAGDCTNAAKYYKSCVCGAKGSETFDYGEATHVYDQEVVKEEYVKYDEVGDTGKSLYYKSCKCGAKGTDVFLYSPDTPAVWDGSVATEFAGGSGTWDDPYQITSGAHLALISEVINYGIDGEDYDLGGIYFKVMNDIDMNGIPFEPIGGEIETVYFSGYFDGNNKVISNLNLVSEYGSQFMYVGLFGCVKDAVISNVILKDLYKTDGITAQTFFMYGTLVGRAINSQIINCHVESDLVVEPHEGPAQTTIYAGGLIGFMLDGGLVKGCTYNGVLQVNGRFANEDKNENRAATVVGGLVGRLDLDAGTDDMKFYFEDCIVSGKLYTEGPTYQMFRGGLVGVAFNGWGFADSVTPEATMVYFKNILVTADIDVSNANMEGVPDSNRYCRLGGIIAYLRHYYNNSPVSCDMDNVHYVGTISGEDNPYFRENASDFAGIIADSSAYSTHKNVTTSYDKVTVSYIVYEDDGVTVKFEENWMGQWDRETCFVGTTAYGNSARLAIETSIISLCTNRGGTDVRAEGYDTGYLSSNFDVNDPWAKSPMEWSFDEATGTLTIWGECAMPDYIWNSTPWNDHDRDIKTVIIKEGITRIGNSAFNGCYYMTSVTIPSSVKSIGSGAFDWCEELNEITIPSSVTSIENYAFRGCGSLTSITVEEGNTVYHSSGNCLIETAANTLIQGCSNSEIPNYVTSIGEYAFYDCYNLTSITIPSSVTSIGYSAFGNCYSLTAINVADGNPVYYSVGNCVIERTTKTIVLGCRGSVIPTDSNVATSIGTAAFEQMIMYGMRSITIPSNIVSIGASAFNNCFMREVIISDGVESIGNSAFGACYDLEKVYLPSSVTSIGDRVFRDCEDLTAIVFCGTETEWNAIEKGTDWDIGTGEYTVSYHEYEAVEGDAVNCKTCAICGYGVGHIYDKKVATEEYFAEAANCLQAAKYYKSCVCGKAGEETFFYGETAGHIYDREEATDTYKNADADCENAASYFKSCVCGEKGSELFYVGKALGHSGGTATCTEQAVCGTCGKPYGNKLDHTFDKELATDTYFVSSATCTSGAKYYKSCVCGAKGSATFEVGEKLPHSYTQQSTSSLYLKTEASCTTKAVYYYSCSCGAKGTQTFESGDYYHSFTNEVANETYKKTDATCESAAVYYKSCICGMINSDTFTVGSALGHSGGTATCSEKAVCTVCNQPYGETLSHVFDQEKAESKYLASEATCESAAKYYKSCVCGEKGTDTFESGEKLAHTFDEKVTDAKYLKSAATCEAKAVYYYSCECGEAGTETFEDGELLEHSFDNGKVTLEPTVEAEGVKTYTCTVCGEEKTEAIDKLEDVGSGDIEDTKPDDSNTEDSGNADTGEDSEDEKSGDVGCFGLISFNGIFVLTLIAFAALAVLRKKENA